MMPTLTFSAPKLRVLIILAALLIALSSRPVRAGVLDDNVPREKAKKPKLKPPAYVP